MANTPLTVETEMELALLHQGVEYFLEGMVRVAPYIDDEQELAAATLIQNIMAGPYNAGVEALGDETDFRPHTHNIVEMVKEEQERRQNEDV